ncbi:heparinase II/III domain-containing protein [Colwellia maritima]|nr:heparinase II/III family protein [Colwellia maritima]
MVRTKFLFREAYESKIFPGILPEAFLELIWFNPAIAQQSPDALPLTKYFPDLGLVVMRSSRDTEATHLSFKSSPPGGHKQWKLSRELDKKNNWKTRSLTHYHVDFNHFILIHNDASLAIDEGYNRTSKAEVHNLITVDGTGCVGEKIWGEGDLSNSELFDLNCKGIHNVWRDVPKDAIAKIEAFSNDNGYTYAVGESSKMYYPEMELTRNARHIINSECGYFIFLDELESELEHTYTWRMHSEKYASQVNQNQFEIINGTGALNVFTVFPEARITNVDETLVEEVMTPQRPDDIRRISLKTLLIENAEKSKKSYFLNVLQPKDTLQGKLSNDISVQSIKGDGCFGVEITSKNHIETFIFSNENKIAYQEIESESKWISVVKDKVW